MMRGEVVDVVVLTVKRRPKSSCGSAGHEINVHVTRDSA